MSDDIPLEVYQAFAGKYKFDFASFVAEWRREHPTTKEIEEDFEKLRHRELQTDADFGFNIDVNSQENTHTEPAVIEQQEEKPKRKRKVTDAGT
jgi:hypothetical protein